MVPAHPLRMTTSRLGALAHGNQYAYGTLKTGDSAITANMLSGLSSTYSSRADGWKSIMPELGTASNSCVNSRIPLCEQSEYADDE